MKEEKVPHTRKPLRGQRREVGRGKLRSHGGECSNRGAEGKAERFPAQRTGANQHSPAREACLLTTGTGGGWEVRSQGED